MVEKLPGNISGRIQKGILHDITTKKKNPGNSWRNHWYKPLEIFLRNNGKDSEVNF